MLGGQFTSFFFVRNGDYDPSMLKFEHKSYLME